MKMYVEKKILFLIISVIMVMLTVINLDCITFAAEKCDFEIVVDKVEIDSAEELMDGGIIGSIFEDEFDETVEYIYKLREEGKTFEEIDIILGQRYYKKNSDVKGIAVSDLFYDYAHLNSQERALYKMNKAKALLCLANGKLALSYSQSLYKNSVLHNGNGDAFRHVLWNFGMAIDVGQSFAEKWANAHEYGAIGQPTLEKKMDLYNNSVGRLLAKKYPNTVLHSTFKKYTKTAVRTGCCKIIKNNRLVKSSKIGEK